MERQFWCLEFYGSQASIILNVSNLNSNTLCHFIYCLNFILVSVAFSRKIFREQKQNEEYSFAILYSDFKSYDYGVWVFTNAANSRASC